jgi:hypothetical protein
MELSHKARLPRNRKALPASLPLFAWADLRSAHPKSLAFPRSARVLSRRFGLPMASARAIAELAGLSLEPGNV